MGADEHRGWHPEEMLLDPPSDHVEMIDTNSGGVIVTEVTVPVAVDTGMDPVACVLRQMAQRLQAEADAGTQRVVLAVQVQYERDPFDMIYGTIIHAPRADHDAA